MQRIRLQRPARDAPWVSPCALLCGCNGDPHSSPASLQCPLLLTQEIHTTLLAVCSPSERAQDAFIDSAAAAAPEVHCTRKIHQSWSAFLPPFRKVFMYFCNRNSAFTDLCATLKQLSIGRLQAHPTCTLLFSLCTWSCSSIGGNAKD